MSSSETTHPCSLKSLCDACQNIDFAKAAELEVPGEDGKAIVVAHLDNLKLKAQSTECELCQFFAKVRSKRVSSTQYNLLAFSAFEWYLGLRAQSGVKDTVIFGVFPEDIFPYPHSRRHYMYMGMNPGNNSVLFYPSWENRVPASNEISGQWIRPAAMDLGPVKEWLEFCRENHPDCCSPTSSSPLVGFNLIDCRSRRVVAATDKAHEYVALSYVWGASSTMHQTTADGTLLDLPATIEDAMSVTLELGYQFLWVDRYCIDQCSESKHDQIRQMDKIYEEAELTIVASAGENPYYGLPGVRGTVRKAQPGVRLGPLVLSLIPPPPDREISRSKWARRAWTFQEGLLSRRRLVITETQYYFQCRVLHRTECLQIPLRPLHFANGRHCDIDIASAFPLSKLGRAAPLRNFQSLVQEYMTKELSFPSDKLNAFLGILNAFIKSESPVFHHWGIPVRSSRSASTSNWPSALCEGLSWWSDEGSTRRPGFPSWSWVGWKSKTVRGWYIDGWGDRGPAESTIPISFQLESKDGTPFPLKDINCLHQYQKDHSRLSPILIVVTWTLECSLEPELPNSGSRLVVHSIPSYLSYLVEVETHLDLRQGVLHQYNADPVRCKGLILSCDRSFMDSASLQLFVMLVRQSQGSDRYERLGVARIFLRTLASSLHVYRDEMVELADMVLGKELFRLG